MKQFNTTGIVLTRVDYGEADRILSFLTPSYGKVSALAKGVRKTKSKLAGGIELFSISELTFIEGKSNLRTLISSRLVRHYGHIVKDLDRTNAGYEFIKNINKATEENPEEAYYHLLGQSFAGLDDFDIPTSIVVLWFSLQLLKLAGHSPNLHTDTDGKKLQAGHTYDFDYDQMSFTSHNGSGSFTAEHIKFLRLGFSSASPQVIKRVEGGERLTADVYPLAKSMLQTHVRL